MASIKQFDFERSRGIVWVCDLANSSKYINDNRAVDDLEEFLPRLYWTSSVLVEAAGGTFVKWTGDGFLAWFETPLHRLLGERAAAVFQAALHLTFLINVTQLGLEPTQKFKIRHGVTYEEDALLIRITHPEGHESLDLIGRAVVLAFRLSGIPAVFPGIVTQRSLVSAADGYRKSTHYFKKWEISANERLKYFKGEGWGGGSIYASAKRTHKSSNLQSTLRGSKKLVKQVIAEAVQADTLSEEDITFAKRFLAGMESGPEWCREVVAKHLKFIREDLLGGLKKLVPTLEGINPYRREGTASTLRPPRGSKKRAL